MIYELSLVTGSYAGEKGAESARKMACDVIKAHGGEVLVEDDWGRLTFAQPASSRESGGYFTYIIYKTSDITCNAELSRRFRIDETVLRNLLVKMSDDDTDSAEIIKNLRIPYSKSHRGEVIESEEGSSADGAEGKGRRKFNRHRRCWFTANKTRADWKNPETFSWLINEFGKISPARISGVSRKHQRFATTAIKRARQIGIASYVSNCVAE